MLSRHYDMARRTPTLSLVIQFAHLQSTLSAPPSDLPSNGTFQPMRELGADDVVDLATLQKGESSIIVKPVVSR